MSKEIDRRDHSAVRANVLRKLDADVVAAAVTEVLPGDESVHVASLNASTGNASLVRSAGTPALNGDFVRRAQSHLTSIHRALGFSATQPPEFAADNNAQQTSSGAAVVHFQQRYKNIPIFEATQAVRFAPNGAVSETVGSSVTVDEDLSALPDLPASDAARIAATHCATPDDSDQTDPYGEPRNKDAWCDVSQYSPKILARFADIADQPTVLEQGPMFEPVKASLVWFDLDGRLRLAWQVLLTMPDQSPQYRTLVDAKSGEILLCRQLTRTVLAMAKVHVPDGGSPLTTVSLPRALAEYGLSLPSDLPDGFPAHWVSTNDTAGNAVIAHFDSDGPTVKGVLKGNSVVFEADPSSDDQRVINLFYSTCLMHNLFYLLGFREGAGNFQNDNALRGGLGADRVDARVFAGVVDGTARMNTGVDGVSPIMNMGIITKTNRHSALDSGIVFHEFTHGVTTRLVGGPQNISGLEMPQSTGMGEGWGDYFACTVNDTTVVGAWAVDKPKGIRRFPYDSSYPDHFGKLGSGDFTEEHNIGEIWCATLMEINRNIGKSLGVQLVVDALKLSPSNPSFLDQRDSILRALDYKLAGGQMASAAYTEAKRGIWAAFAKFGMGPGAKSNGASLKGIVADFNFPLADDALSSVKAEARPNLRIPDNDSTGVSSIFRINEAGRVKRLSVSLNVNHASVGDLRILLRSPKGTSAVLYDRTSGAPNLNATYTSEGTPSLAQFAGESIAGDWVLVLSDLAREDEGVLQNWSIEIGTDTAAPSFQQEALPGLLIPDDDPNGVVSTIRSSMAGTARRIMVNVDITHPSAGDLRLELVAPGGTTALLLKQQSGVSGQNLRTEFDSSSHPGLGTLLNKPVQGVWALRIQDLVPGGTGKFNGWGLKFYS